MQLISWLRLGPLHQLDERQTDALGLLCDEQWPFLLAFPFAHSPSLFFLLSLSFLPIFLPIFHMSGFLSFYPVFTILQQIVGILAEHKNY